MNSIKVCEYSRSRSFHDDLILQDQASGERSQDHWSSGFLIRIALIQLKANCKPFGLTAVLELLYIVLNLKKTVKCEKQMVENHHE